MANFWDSVASDYSGMSTGNITGDLREITEAADNSAGSSFVFTRIVKGLSAAGKRTARTHVLWVLEQGSTKVAIPNIGANLVSFYSLGNSGEKYAFWYCTSREVTYEGPDAAKVQATWTYFAETEEFTGVIAEVTTSQWRKGSGNTATTVVVPFSKPTNPYYQAAGVINIRIPKLILRIKRNYGNETALIAALDTYLGRENSATFKGKPLRTWLATDIQTSQIGEDGPYNAIWTLEWAGDGQTHDPVVVYKEAGICPTGVQAIHEWDSGGPVNFDASSPYWQVDGKMRCQYYFVADFNNL